MQLMPQTASFMQKKTIDNGNPAIIGSVFEPIPNITLGQDYVEHLLNNELVEGNLFYLLAAYNAGPGRLQDWKAHISANADPLLFVESIPYGQTRNYVMQVMTNYWIYSELDGSDNKSIYAVLKGNWPSYEPYVASVPAQVNPHSSPNGA
jgi:soluble lytic murein transglycosylase-like protein